MALEVDITAARIETERCLMAIRIVTHTVSESVQDVLSVVRQLQSSEGG